MISLCCRCHAVTYIWAVQRLHAYVWQSSPGRLEDCFQCLNACCDVTVQEPCLQVQMSEDSAERGFYLSALHAFVTRTCYANAGGEQHMLSAAGMLACFLCII